MILAELELERGARTWCSSLQVRINEGLDERVKMVIMSSYGSVVMEAEGLVSPATGGKAREVLVGREYFEEVDAQLR